MNAPLDPPAGAARRLALTAAALAVAGLLALCRTEGTWLDGPRLAASLAAVILVSAGAWWSGIRHGREHAILPPAGLLALGLLLALSSNWAEFRWFMLLGWSEKEAFHWPSVHLIYLVLLLPAGLLMIFRPRGWRGAAAALVVLPIVAGVFRVWTLTGGEALYRDDHPSFLYRMWLFRETFPRMVNYVPQWNAGTVDATPILTGAWIPGLLGFPWWCAADPHVGYTAAFLWMFMILVPALAAASVRMLGGSWLAAACAAALALVPSRFYSLWLIHFGTLGGNFAMALVMPLAGMLHVLRRRGGPTPAGDRTPVHPRRKLADGEAAVPPDNVQTIKGPEGIQPRSMPTWLLAAGLAGVVVLMNLWPLSPFMALPFALVLLANATRTPRRALYAIGLAVLAAGAILAPYLLTLLRQAGIDAGALAGAPRPPAGILAARGGELLANHLRMTHPVLVFLGLAAPFVVLRGETRRTLLPLTLGFLLLAGWADQVFPGRQLHRMGIALAFALVPSAALVLDDLFARRTALAAGLSAAGLALAAASGWNGAFLFEGRGVETYHTLTPGLRELAQTVQRACPPEGRVILAGAVGEDYENGHMGYLPVLFQREVLGNAYRHDQDMSPWAGTPPGAIPATPEEFRAWIDTFAGHLVIALHDDWRDYLLGQPESYEPLPPIDTRWRVYSLFRVRNPAGRFAVGSGRIEARPNRLAITLDDPGAEAVIRYRWADGLTPDPPAELRPEPVNAELDLIRIQPHGTREVILRYRGER